MKSFIIDSLNYVLEKRLFITQFFIQLKSELINKKKSATQFNYLTIHEPVN